MMIFAAKTRESVYTIDTEYTVRRDGEPVFKAGSRAEAVRWIAQEADEIECCAGRL